MWAIPFQAGGLKKSFMVEVISQIVHIKSVFSQCSSTSNQKHRPWLVGTEHIAFLSKVFINIYFISKEQVHVFLIN